MLNYFDLMLISDHQIADTLRDEMGSDEEN